MKRKKKIWIIIKWIIGITIIFILLGIIWNTICKKIDEYKIKDAYGNSVQIDGKSMVVEIAGAEHDGPPIILLPGLGEPSPILEFKPLASELAKKYKVITIEPFGYGLSDGTKRDRTIENIVEELHECVKNLGEEEYYLMGHSISGIYSLYWSQIYPNEIKGIIGIDPSVPKMTSKENNPFPVSVQLLNQISAYTRKIVNITGVTRLLSINNPKKVVYADPQYLYSEKELEVFRILTLDKGYNATVMAEMKNLEKNMEVVEDMKIPREIPILEFVSKENCKTMPQWEQLHRDIIADKENGKVILLEGSHYLHFEQKKAIVERTTQWIDNR